MNSGSVNRFFTEIITTFLWIFSGKDAPKQQLSILLPIKYIFLINHFMSERDLNTIQDKRN